MEDKPRNLKAMLAEAKDTSELMVDLAYAALCYADETMAEAVQSLEEDMSELVHEMRSLALLAVRHPREVDGMSSVLQVVSSIEQIANAAVDIAKVVMRELSIPRVLLVALAQAVEVSHQIKVAETSELANRPLGELELPDRVGMRIVAQQRGRRWSTELDRDTVLEPGDTLFMRGDPAGIGQLRELADAGAWEPPKAQSEPDVSDVGRAVEVLVNMKDLSEAAIGLAYSALVLRDVSLARQVASLSERLDAMKVSMQTWVLRAAASGLEPETLRGLLHVAEAAEDIGDMARNIVALVLDDEDVHPVLELALGDTDDVVMVVPVAQRSAADGATLGSLGLAVDPGYGVLAIRRAEHYSYNPPKSAQLRVGDELIASGPEEGRGRFAAVCGYDVEVDEETGRVSLLPHADDDDD